MTDKRPSERGRGGSGAEAVLEATFELASGPRRVRLVAGGATVVDGPEAAAMVRALAHPDPVMGRLLLRGTAVGHLSLAARTRRGLVVVGPDPVAPDVSVRDHLAAISGPSRADELLRSAPLLAGRGDAPAGVLSGGERRLLGFLRAEALEPVIAILDRAAAGLDDEVLAWVGDLVASWRRRGTALVIRPARPEERGWAAP